MPLSDQIQKAKAFLRARRIAYRRILDPATVDGAAVLADLAKFCRAHSSTAHPDPHIAARLDGRREVWLRIQEHLQLTDDQLWRLYGGAAAVKGD